MKQKIEKKIRNWDEDGVSSQPRLSSITIHLCSHGLPLCALWSVAYCRDQNHIHFRSFFCLWTRAACPSQFCSLWVGHVCDPWVHTLGSLQCVYPSASHNQPKEKSALQLRAPEQGRQTALTCVPEGENQAAWHPLHLLDFVFSDPCRQSRPLWRKLETCQT